MSTDRERVHKLLGVTARLATVIRNEIHRIPNPKVIAIILPEDLWRDFLVAHDEVWFAVDDEEMSRLLDGDEQ